ncbi:N-formylglutamate amidohydrolase [Parasulfitobacter algicola]|uniref:N-formylglutamate amidohydrolase n=1 Tax=Parasulfitobacter algicola TaxID=2614809 RepID=A0ABX2IWD5_9RHOB|nr:N-formylglutamate amidohydrolase [Sulfitobacter algicola]NSX54538.1 N-formylglutamate amidohydrolase [Sulfitobacter algicola]
MAQSKIKNSYDIVRVVNADATSRVVLVCEHASRFIPDHLDHLGLSQKDRDSHAAWDPGALVIAERLSKSLNAKLVISGVSRLVYDCNRPPDAPDAMPDRSELIEIPGNKGLDVIARAHRAARYYEPFRTTLAQTIAATSAPIIMTIHSFTPVYHGEKRDVDIGILHDSDMRLANALLDIAPKHTHLQVRRNQPYGPEHGVTHTLKEHAISGGHLNVMLEIRNDLIITQHDQAEMAEMLAAWLTAALAHLQTKSTA